MSARARRGGGLGATHGGVAVLASLLLIASGLATGCRYPRVVDSPFAADDEYPRLFWMFTLFEVPADADLPPLGPLPRAAPDGASGISSAPRVECMSAASVEELFRSIDACPGAWTVFCPAIVSAPGARETVELSVSDKAGAWSAEFFIAATGWLDDEGLAIEVLLHRGDRPARRRGTLRRGDAGDGCTTGVRRVDEEMALILVCAAADGAATRALLVVRPKVVRTADDRPVQRAGTAGT